MFAEHFQKVPTRLGQFKKVFHTASVIYMFNIVPQKTWNNLEYVKLRIVFMKGDWQKRVPIGQMFCKDSLVVMREWSTQMFRKMLRKLSIKPFQENSHQMISELFRLSWVSSHLTFCWDWQPPLGASILFSFLCLWISQLTTFGRG